VLLFDSNLRLLWEHSVEADLGDGYLGEVALLVHTARMREGDQGVVVVGGRVHSNRELKRQIRRNVAIQSEAEEEEEEEEEFISSSRKVGQGVFEQGEGAEEGDHKEEAEEEEDEEQETLLDSGKTFDGDSHFSYFALDGRSGEVRWSHQAGDFEQEVSGADILRPQHQAHSGETDWRAFRQYILHSLPHLWSVREHTKFELAHFERKRAGKGREAAQEHEEYMAESARWTTDLFGGLRPHSEEEHVASPNCFVAHHKDGIEVIHLYTGRPLCRLSLSKSVLHVDVNGDGIVDHVEAVAGSYIPYALTHQAHSHFKAPKCLALVRSGVPPSMQLFNGSVCLPPSLPSSLIAPTAQEIKQAIYESERNRDVKVSSPAVLQHIASQHDQGPRRFHSLFFTDAGNVLEA